MDPVIGEALADGRTVIVPSRQRAAALKLAWARHQQAAGARVWTTPDVLTFDAWLSREWQRARDGGRLSRSLQRLNQAQERRLWSEVLDELEQEEGGETPLREHAAALIRSATRVRQSLITPGRQAITVEERLLASALARVGQRAASRDWISLGLAKPEDFVGLRAAAPLVVGQSRLPGLQQQLAATLWPGADLLAPRPGQPGQDTSVFPAPDPVAEIHAVAAWCRGHIDANRSARLLVVDAAGRVSLPATGTLLWNALTAGTRDSLGGGIDPRVLCIEGGEPLLQHALIGDALAALGCLREPLDSALLSRLLLSPYLRLVEPAAAVRLDGVLRDLGCARWSTATLRHALQALAGRLPAAAQLDAGLAALASHLQPRERLAAVSWAARFDSALAQSGFPGDRQLDSRDAQRFARWRELLDEFSSLDAVADPMTFSEALQQLELLARQGRHEAASPDAAITLTDSRCDPVVQYDGIWVLGLTEAVWPEPPRPDPYVSLAEQRRCNWPEASVALRQEQARWELAGWQARTPQLVLSHAQYDGDLHQRPAVLLRNLPVRTAGSTGATQHVVPSVSLETLADEQLPPFAAAGGAIRLRHGTRVAQLQQQCPFRAQAELRLGATPVAIPQDGIDARLRGQLLHGMLESLWSELEDSARLLRLDAAEQQAMLERCWDTVAGLVLARRPATPDRRVVARERRRCLAVLAAVLDIERTRPPFRVVGREQQVTATFDGVGIDLRIDRIDELAGGERFVIDYKSGKAERVDLDGDPPQPLQLAIYAQALAQGGQAPMALGLLALAPGKQGYAGACAAREAGFAGVKPLADWSAASTRWNQQVTRLLHEYVNGDARVLPAKGACATCHLPALCRIGLEDGTDE